MPPPTKAIKEIRMATTEQRPAATQKRYRTLAVVKQEAITRIEKQLEDSVFVWPHLLVREFLSSVLMTVVLTVVSLAIDAPLRAHSGHSLTPNSAKAPCYVLGLQEQLHYFPPTIAGVLVPIVGVPLVLILLPYIGRNPSRAFEDRKLSITLFSIFALYF